ncbi:MAG: CNNM domain-containing protein [Planctomycetota bacterium]
MMAQMQHLEASAWLLLCAVFVVLSGFFSGAETGLYCVNRLRLRLASHRNKPGARRLQRLFDDQTGLLFTTLIGTNAANYLAPVCLTVVLLGSATAGMSDVLRESLERRAELLTTLILTPVVFIFGEIVPKNLFQSHADRYMPKIAAYLDAFHSVVRLTGIAWLQRRISALMAGGGRQSSQSGSAFHTRVGMYQVLRDSAEEGTLSKTQVFMLERIPTLHALRVAAVMIPRSRAVMIEARATRYEIEKIVRNSPYSRMPVYRGTRQRVVGVVHVLDILTGDSETPLVDYARIPVRLAHDLPVIDALTTLQRSRRRMAIVTDKGGRFLGLVTVKDLVEEIVGELPAW